MNAEYLSVIAKNSSAETALYHKRPQSVVNLRTTQYETWALGFILYVRNLITAATEENLNMQFSLYR